MKKRILSTLGLWAIVVIALVTLGATGGILLLAVLGFLAQRECHELLRRMGYPPLRSGLIWGPILIISPWVVVKAGGEAGALSSMITLAAIVVGMILALLARPTDPKRPGIIMATLFALLLVPFCLQFLVQIALMAPVYSSAGLLLVVWVVAVAKFTDVGGLLIGMKLGRNKLAPAISPGKTREGAVGGILAAMAVGLLLVLIIGTPLRDLGLTPLKALLLAFPIAVMAIASDLVESVIKRQACSKDSGQVIPGIGGAFDLVDSLLLTAPLAWGLFMLTL